MQHNHKKTPQVQVQREIEKQKRARKKKRNSNDRQHQVIENGRVQRSNAPTNITVCRYSYFIKRVLALKAGDCPGATNVTIRFPHYCSIGQNMTGGKHVLWLCLSVRPSVRPPLTIQNNNVRQQAQNDAVKKDLKKKRDEIEIIPSKRKKTHRKVNGREL